MARPFLALVGPPLHTNEVKTITPSQLQVLYRGNLSSLYNAFYGPSSLGTPDSFTYFDPNLPNSAFRVSAIEPGPTDDLVLFIRGEEFTYLTGTSKIYTGSSSNYRFLAEYLPAVDSAYKVISSSLDMVNDLNADPYFPGYIIAEVHSGTGSAYPEQGLFNLRTYKLSGGTEPTTGVEPPYPVARVMKVDGFYSTHEVIELEALTDSQRLEWGSSQAYVFHNAARLSRGELPVSVP